MRLPVSSIRLSRALLACALCLLAFLLAGCGQSASNKSDANNLPEIVVGSDIYPPFVYEDSSGNYTGIDVDLATEAFRRMGYKAVFKKINWEKKTELVESGEIDCIWGCFSIDGREDQYRWAGPYMKSRQVVGVLADSDIKSLSDLVGKSVAVQSTTKPEELFLSGKDERIPELAEVVSLQDRELVYPALSKGYVDAVAAHETTINQCAKNFGIDYRILDEPLLEANLGVAFAKSDNRGLDEQLTQTFKDMYADGTIAYILASYLDESDKYLEGMSTYE